MLFESSCIKLLASFICLNNPPLIADKVWRKDIGLKVYMGEFIASNVTITELIDPNTGEIVVNCSVWANPRPNIQLFVDTEVNDSTCQLFLFFSNNYVTSTITFFNLPNLRWRCLGMLSSLVIRNYCHNCLKLTTSFDNIPEFFFTTVNTFQLQHFEIIIKIVTVLAILSGYYLKCK